MSLHAGASLFTKEPDFLVFLIIKLIILFGTLLKVYIKFTNSILHFLFFIKILYMENAWVRKHRQNPSTCKQFI